MDGNHDPALVFQESYMLGMRAGLWSRIDAYVEILKNTHPLQPVVHRCPLTMSSATLWPLQLSHHELREIADLPTRRTVSLLSNIVLTRTLPSKEDS